LGLAVSGQGFMVEIRRDDRLYPACHQIMQGRFALEADP
jgi:hypothetical protein